MAHEINISRDTAYTLYRAAVGYESMPLCEDTRDCLHRAQAELRGAVEKAARRRERTAERRQEWAAGIVLFTILAALAAAAVWIWIARG